MTKILKTLALALAMTTPLSFMGGISTVRAMEGNQSIMCEYCPLKFGDESVGQINWRLLAPTSEKDAQIDVKTAMRQLKNVYYAGNIGFKASRGNAHKFFNQAMKYCYHLTSLEKSGSSLSEGREIHLKALRMYIDHFIAWGLTNPQATGTYLSESDHAPLFKVLFKNKSEILGYTQEDFYGMFKLGMANVYYDEKRGCFAAPHNALFWEIVEQFKITDSKSGFLVTQAHQEFFNSLLTNPQNSQYRGYLALFIKQVIDEADGGAILSVLSHSNILSHCFAIKHYLELSRDQLEDIGSHAVKFLQSAENLAKKTEECENKKLWYLDEFGGKNYRYKQQSQEELKKRYEFEKKNFEEILLKDLKKASDIFWRGENIKAELSTQYPNLTHIMGVPLNDIPDRVFKEVQTKMMFWGVQINANFKDFVVRNFIEILIKKICKLKKIFEDCYNDSF